MAQEQGDSLAALARRPRRTLVFGLAATCLILAGLGLAARSPEAGAAFKRIAESVRQAEGAWFALYLVLYLAVSALVINSPVPLAAFLKVGGGFLFGVVAGSSINVAMSGLGGAIGFVAVRRAFGEGFARRAGARLNALNAEFTRGGFWYVLFCRLALVFPFCGVNVACGLSGVSFRDFVLATVIGVAPVSVLYAVTGATLSAWSLDGAAPSGAMLAILVVLAVAALIPPLAARSGFGKKAIGRLKE